MEDFEGIPGFEGISGVDPYFLIMLAQKRTEENDGKGSEFVELMKLC